MEKDAGLVIPWLPMGSANVPKKWKILPCKAIVENINIRNDGAVDQNYLSLMANMGVIPYADKGNVGNKKPDDLAKCKIVKRGNFVINSMNYSIGSYGMSDYDGVCSPVYIVLKIHEDVVLPRFAFRIFENKAFQKYVASLGNGILEYRAAIGWDDIKNLNVQIPPKEEQQVILDILDCNTGQIDQLIAQRKKAMELLDELRASIIQQAVTRGLDPSVPMKDSGLPCLGEIPAHWEIKRLKFLTNERIVYGVNEVSLGDDPTNPRFLRITDIDNDGRLRDDTSKTLDYKLAKPYLLQDGDILFARSGATIGKTFLYQLQYGEACFASYLVRFRPNQKRILPKFISYFSQTATYWAQIHSSAIQSTIENFSGEKYANIQVVTPPIVEQINILSNLEIEMARFEHIRSSYERQIVLLSDYRTSLIHEYVTGQRTVS